MISHINRIVLGASLALFVGAAGAQNAPDSTSRMPTEKGTMTTMPAQPSEQSTNKMSGYPNAGAQDTAAPKNNRARYAHRSARQQSEAVSPDEQSYRQALRQCVREPDESQRDACIDNAIGQHQPNS